MSRKYKFRNNDALYFVSFATINWIDIFIRNEYKEIILDSWRYCMKNKGLDIYAWCIMTSHIHLIIGTHKNKMEDIMRDMKSFTSTQIKKAIKEHPRESRKKWIMELMQKAGLRNCNNNDFQFWQQNNNPIELYNNRILKQKLDYIHNNPVKSGFVVRPEDFLYSSARDYAGEKGLLDIIIIE